MATLTLVDGRANESFKIEVSSDGQVRVGDASYYVRGEPDGTLLIEGPQRTTAWVAAVDGVRWVFLDGRVYELVESQQPGRTKRGGHAGALSAPMPATVRRVLVEPGATVKAGDTLLILEAMKMELPVRASAAGQVRAVNCREGELVQPGVDLVEMDEQP
jgi:3-methylcrotonyl-CoA carboxylase alpha subunit